jgi:hypothetical protein
MQYADKEGYEDAHKGQRTHTRIGGRTHGVEDAHTGWRTHTRGRGRTQAGRTHIRPLVAQACRTHTQACKTHIRPLVAQACRTHTRGVPTMDGDWVRDIVFGVPQREIGLMVGDWDGAGCSRALIRPHQPIPYVEFTEKYATHPHHASFTPILREKRASKTNPVHSRDAPCVRPAGLRASSDACVCLPPRACVLLSTRASCQLARPTDGYASCQLARPTGGYASCQLARPTGGYASCQLARPTGGYASCMLVCASSRLACASCMLARPTGGYASYMLTCASSALWVRPHHLVCVPRACPPNARFHASRMQNTPPARPSLTYA